MSKIIICPDVHCRSFYKPVLVTKDVPIIFLGDYLCPYYGENTSTEDGIANLEEIIDFKKKNSDRVTLLVGNHDISQIWSYGGWERTSYKFYKDMHALYRENIEYFEPCKLINDTLFTHAGVSRLWLSRLNLNETNIIKFIKSEFSKTLNFNVMFRESPRDAPYLKSKLFDIGYIRGGDSTVGGPFWNDIREFDDPNWNLYQIAGHTQLETTGNFIRKGNTFFCDSRSLFEYDLETHNLIKKDEC